jgi:hypothetical protein
MRELNYGLKNLVKEHSKGSFSTNSARQTILQQAADTLHELGYGLRRPDGLKPKHVEALVNHWKANELTSGTMKNRMAHIRWWAQKADKAPVVARSNEFYNIENRAYVTGENKARVLDERLDKVTDAHTRMSLELQAAFGLRREEAIKFSPTYADKGDHLQLKASWTKGGKAREIPIRTDKQRQLLDATHRFAGRGAMIPKNKNYIQQLRTYERNTTKATLDRMHGLRHAYAQQRYEDLTGQKCPIQGGASRRSLDGEALALDTEARQIISREMGHERLAVVSVYIGS